jgi:5'-3' exoribonuclease 2
LIQRKVEENNPKVHNLYLDMNGIIHPCCHPLDRPQPTSETEMFGLIFEYMDRVIGIVKPSKILYLAIDGVAPRAKMNQQRSRRFRTALDAQEKAERTTSIKNKWAAEGIKFTDRPTEGAGQTFDSNVITPGTEFMANLSKALQLCIVERLHNSERWQNLQVIFSDASVPGEGEHKILDFIRSQRAQKNYDPNTSHCIHGADADLIMLGLSTHEAHFYILREAVLQEKDKKCRRCH